MLLMTLSFGKEDMRNAIHTSYDSQTMFSIELSTAGIIYLLFFSVLRL